MEILIFLGVILSAGLSAVTLYKVMKLERGLAAQKEAVDPRTEDEVYEQAKAVAMEAGRVSASFLQRRLRIGYARAARLLDMLEDNGVIEPHTGGTEPRKVIISQKKRVLLIDDDPFISDMFAQRFKAEGFDVTTWKDANGDFIENVLAVNPDIISLDIIMPERTGFDAIQLLKQDKRTADIPVILESNMSEKDVRQQALELGAVDHLVIANHTPEEFVQTFVEYLRNPQKYKGRIRIQ